MKRLQLGVNNLNLAGIRRRTGRPALLLAVSLLLLAAACSKSADAKSGGEGGAKGGGEAKAPPPIPVVIGTAIQSSAPIDVNNIGTVEAQASVAVKSKVEGEIVKVNFREGQEVKAGDVLFEIDRRAYEIAEHQAEAEYDRQKTLKTQTEANLTRDQATLQNAESELKRDSDLLAKGISSKDEFDKADAAAKSARAVVASDEAALATADQTIRAAQIDIDSARLKLSYCTLTAPIDGRLGSLLVHQGNLVKADSDAGLVVINRMRPIYVSFTLPEKYLGTINSRLRQGAMRTTAAIPGADGSLTTGTLTFVDNQVDSQTGTIRLKAEFPNENEQLWPGQFVNVTLALDEIKDATMVPKRTLVTGQNGMFCFVVDGEMTVHSRNVEAGEEVGDKIVVKSGLKPGERIVLDGQLRLTDGSRVSEKKDIGQSAAPAAAPAGAPAAAPDAAK